MKNLFITWLLIGFPALAQCQGQFIYSNITAPTRVGSINGPLAGTGIWGQLLVGTATNSLAPVGVAMEHLNGRIGQGIFIVPSVEPDTFAYVQVVAWNATQWGTLLSGVPTDQIGRSDIVLHPFTQDPQPAFAPLFTQGAVVPAVPEPATFALTVVGAGVLWFAARTRRRISFPRPPAPK